MRYEIKEGVIKESFFIDAPYDTQKDALEDLNKGIKHACIYCSAEYPCELNKGVIK